MDQSRQPSSSSGSSSFNRSIQIIETIFDMRTTVKKDANPAVRRRNSTDGQSTSTSFNSCSDSKKSKHLHDRYQRRLEMQSPNMAYELAPKKQVRRTVLDLDPKFFPTGLQPGTIMELKGGEGTGKTFLITYFLARLVTTSPIKTALLIDTSHHFSLKNLIAIISNLDPDISYDKTNLSLSVADILKANLKLNGYLDRISVIKCYSAEQLLVTLGPGHDSTVETMITHDQNLSLVAVDTVDNYSFIKSLKDADSGLYPDFLHLIRHAVTASLTPVICATMTPARPTTAFVVPKDQNTASTSTTPDTLDPPLPTSSSTESELNPQPPPPPAKDWYANIKMDCNIFTHSMYLEKFESNNGEKCKHFGCAHLLSRQRPNTALFSVVNHRAKFSIFSDMLYHED